MINKYEVNNFINLVSDLKDVVESFDADINFIDLFINFSFNKDLFIYKFDSNLSMIKANHGYSHEYPDLLKLTERNVDISRFLSVVSTSLDDFSELSLNVEFNIKCKGVIDIEKVFELDRRILTEF